MKLYKTLLFLLSVMLMLGVTSYYFPEEGLHVEFDFRFPNLRHVLAVQPDDAADETVADAELEAQDEELAYEELPSDLEEITAQDSAFAQYTHSNRTRIILPRLRRAVADTLTEERLQALSKEARARYDSVVNVEQGLVLAYRDTLTHEADLAYFDPLFEAFDSARTQRVRILHYGDSQLEGDRISCVLRERLQSRFGGGGPGILPAQRWVAKITCMQKADPELPYYLPYGAATMRAPHSNYGPIAVVAHADEDVTLSFYPPKETSYPQATQITRATVMRDGPEGIQFDEYEYSKPQSAIRLKVQAPADIYGVMLDQEAGVTVDNVPMRGSSGMVFTRISQKSLAPFFARENVGLIILQYGGNSMPSIGSEQAMRDYCSEMLKQIALLRKLAPKARFLFIGPSDMSTIVNGERCTYPLLPRFVEILEQCMTANGCAYWNLYEVMGGKNSMVRWVKSSPQLAGEDHIHFTRRGAEYVGNLLSEAFEINYNYYKYRHGEADFTLTENNENNDHIRTDLLPNYRESRTANDSAAAEADQPAAATTAEAPAAKPTDSKPADKPADKPAAEKPTDKPAAEKPTDQPVAHPAAEEPAVSTPDKQPETSAEPAADAVPAAQPDSVVGEG